MNRKHVEDLIEKAERRANQNCILAMIAVTAGIIAVLIIIGGLL